MKTVLIVDDEKSFLLSLQDGFKVYENRFAVLTAENGQEAVTILEKHKIDLLITDLEMPFMNGFELLAWTSRKLPRLPVIVMTAFGTPEIESQLAAYESIRYLEKPLDLPTLEKAIFEGLTRDYKSYIQGITPASFLQLLQQEKKTCTLKISSLNRTGYLYLIGGDLIDAEYDCLTGEQAAYTIVCWEQAEIELDALCQRQEVAITESLDAILLNAHKMKDEMCDSAPLESVQEECFSDFTLPAIGAESVNISYLKELQGRVKRHTDVSAVEVFDQNGRLEILSLDGIIAKDFDPTFFFYLAKNMETVCQSGILKCMSFSTSGRIPYLLFQIDGYSMLIKLKSGASVQAVRTRLSQIIEGAVKQQ